MAHHRAGEDGELHDQAVDLEHRGFGAESASRRARAGSSPRPHGDFGGRRPAAHRVEAGKAVLARAVGHGFERG